MRRVLVVDESQSYLMISFKDKFAEMDYEVIVSRADIEELRKITGSIDAILIYANDSLLLLKEALTYVKNKALSSDTALFVTGTPEELQAIEAVIPANTFAEEYERPINVNELAEKMDAYLNKKFASAGRKKILVVDDSGVMLRNIKGWLADKYQVIPVNSGASAIKYLALGRPDLILLDYEMPVCDGRQVLEMLRSEEDFKDIPVIFLTGRSDMESIMEVMSLKPQGYLLKSMKPAQIILAVDNFFAGKS